MVDQNYEVYESNVFIPSVSGFLGPKSSLNSQPSRSTIKWITEGKEEGGGGSREGGKRKKMGALNKRYVVY